MASASVQAGGVGVVQPAQPPPRAAPRSPWAVGTAPDIASVYLRVAGSTPGTPALEGAVRMLQWPERDLRWLDCRPSPPPDAGCLFSSDDAYCDSASAQVLPPWRALPTADRLVPPDPDAAPSAGAGMHWKGTASEAAPEAGWRRLPKRLGAVAVSYKCR